MASGPRTGARDKSVLANRHAFMGARRLASELRSRLSVQRLVFATLICALVSTQLFFQPILYDTFLLEHLLRAWLDYFGECMLMGFSMLLALGVAELVVTRVPPLAAPGVVVCGLLVGAIAGRLLLIPYYDLGWDSAFDRGFWSDVIYWLAIAGGMATIYALHQRAGAAATTLHQAEIDRLELAKQALEARLQVLRAQIEPHFLFNTLANVKRLCHRDPAGGIVMLENLVRYLRAALPRMRETRTTLEQEAELVRAYLGVLQVRMGSRLRYAIAIPAALHAQPFPPMMLLTLVENAIKHGLGPLPDGGTIDVRARAIGGKLEVRVADNGAGFRGAASTGTGVGLANARARLAALFGDAGQLELDANEPTGVVATLRLPLMSYSRPHAGQSLPA